MLLKKNLFKQVPSNAQGTDIFLQWLKTIFRFQSLSVFFFVHRSYSSLYVCLQIFDGIQIRRLRWTLTLIKLLTNHFLAILLDCLGSLSCSTAAEFHQRHILSPDVILLLISYLKAIIIILLKHCSNSLISEYDVP